MILFFNLKFNFMKKLFIVLVALFTFTLFSTATFAGTKKVKHSKTLVNKKKTGNKKVAFCNSWTWMYEGCGTKCGYVSVTRDCNTGVVYSIEMVNCCSGALCA